MRELELMVDYGMQALEVLRSVTSVNAAVFGLADRGRIAPGLAADLLVVTGRPDRQISDLRRVAIVMIGGKIFP